MQTINITPAGEIEAQDAPTAEDQRWYEWVMSPMGELWERYDEGPYDTWEEYERDLEVAFLN